MSTLDLLASDKPPSAAPALNIAGFVEGDLEARQQVVGSRDRTVLEHIYAEAPAAFGPVEPADGLRTQPGNGFHLLLGSLNQLCHGHDLLRHSGKKGRRRDIGRKLHGTSTCCGRKSACFC